MARQVASKARDLLRDIFHSEFLGGFHDPIWLLHIFFKWVGKNTNYFNHISEVLKVRVCLTIAEVALYQPYLVFQRQGGTVTFSSGWIEPKDGRSSLLSIVKVGHNHAVTCLDGVQNCPNHLILAISVGENTHGTPTGSWYMFGWVFKVFHGTIIAPVVKKSLAGTNVQFREDCAKHFAGSPNSSINL